MILNKKLLVNSIIYNILCYSLILVVFFKPVSYADDNLHIIKKVIIEGNSLIHSSTVEEYLTINVGDQVDEGVLNNAIKKLYATKLFDNVKIDLNQGILKVNVVENLFISKIEFVGNDSFESEKILSELSINIGGPLNRGVLNIESEKIKQIYQLNLGYIFVEVDVKVEVEKTNMVKVVFDIKEGPKILVKKIYFIGNNFYSNDELKNTIMTKEVNVLGFGSENSVFNPLRLKTDTFFLANLYKTSGYMDFKVNSITSQLLKSNEGFALIYSIDEGQCYYFADIEIESKLNFINTKDLYRFIPISYGQKANIAVIEKIVADINGYLSNKGFSNLYISYESYSCRKPNHLNIKIIINKRPLAYINKVNITGNNLTKDSVIRNYIPLAEGDILSIDKIKGVKENILSTRYFDGVSINFTPYEQDNNLYDIDVVVEEKASTTSLGLGATWSYPGSFGGAISWNSLNFLGSGNDLFIIAKFNGLVPSIHLSSLFNNIFNTQLAWRISGSVDMDRDNIYNEDIASTSDKYKNIARSVNNDIIYQINNLFSSSIGYSFEYNRVFSKRDNVFSIWINEDFGTFYTSSLNHNLLFSKNDQKSSHSAVLSNNFAVLGGNNNYYKFTAKYTYYRNLFNNNLVFKLTAAGGCIRGIGKEERVKFFNRFSINTNNSLRGFTNFGPITNDEELLGGKNYYTISSELILPIIDKQGLKLTGSLFVDLGSLWGVDYTDTLTRDSIYDSNAMRASVGMAVNILTAIPFKIGIAFPIKLENYDKENNLFVSMEF